MTDFNICHSFEWYGENRVLPPNGRGSVTGMSSFFQIYE